MQKTFISILTLYNYTRCKDYDKQIHLIFLLEGYPDILLNETRALLKAASIHKQYVLSDKIKLFNPQFGNDKIDNFRLKELELAIEEKVENIMALDIALLKFIASVPDRIEQNSFKLPNNTDESYLVGEYINIKEKQTIAKISKAYELYNIAEFNDSFVVAPKLETVVFNNNQYETRIPENKFNQLTQGDIQLKHDYDLLVKFCDKFFQNEKIRSMSDMNSKNIPKEYINFGVDIHQVLYTMASTFSPQDDTNINIRKLLQMDETREQDEPAPSTKKRLLTNMSSRESYIYAYKVMVLFVYFLLIEENTIEDDMPLHIEEYRNQYIRIAQRMLDHLLEYIQFKVSASNYKTIYSMLPLIDIYDTSPRNRPITAMLHMLQYALNFAPFLTI